MAQVFISYKREDADRVDVLRKALKAAGLSVWWDQDIEAGHRWRETIMSALGEARCVIVVWSTGSTGPHGGFVREEANRAQQLGVLLSVCIDRVSPPLGFAEIQALDLVGWKGNRLDGRYRRVLAAVRSQIDGRPRASPDSRSRPLKWAAGLVLGGVLVANANRVDKSPSTGPMTRSTDDPRKAPERQSHPERASPPEPRVEHVEATTRTQAPPDDPDATRERAVALWNEGHALFRSKEHARAEVLYREALAADPTYHKPYNSLGWLAFIEGRYEEAEALYAETLAREPKEGYSPVRVNMGWLRLNQRRCDEAVEWADRALEMHPRSRESKQIKKKVADGYCADEGR